MRSRCAALAVAAVGCVAVNPDWDDDRTAGPAVEDDPTSEGVATLDATETLPSDTSDESSDETSVNAGASATGSGGGSGGGSSAGSGTGSGTGLGAEESSSGSTGAGSSEGSTTQAASPGTVDLGFPCTEDSECDPATGATCCTANQCSGYCFVPCDGDGDCDDDAVSCAHNYCLFECDDEDEDCAPWPGFSCQHGGQFCEV